MKAFLNLMTSRLWLLLLFLGLMCITPLWAHAAGTTGAVTGTLTAGSASAGSLDIHGLNGVLDRLFDEMIPLAGKLIGVAQALAGFGALWFIAVRVWRHIARAEPIDFYPLLRPFALGLVIAFFLPMVRLMNGVLQPIETGTRALVGDSQQAIMLHIAHEENSVKEPPPVGLFPSDGSSGTAPYEEPGGVTGADGWSLSAGLRSTFSFLNIKSTFKTIITSLVNLLYEAAALCINTIRTFYLIIMVILGPIVLGLSVFDGFRHTLGHWFARYINIYMWLPVANIFGAVTSKMLENIMTLDTDFFSSTAYIIFMLISIVGYTTVPSVANYIVHAASGGRGSLLHKVNAMTGNKGH